MGYIETTDDGDIIAPGAWVKSLNAIEAAASKVARAIQHLAAASTPIPRYPAGGVRFEPAYDANGRMVEVSIVPAIIGDTVGPEQAFMRSGVEASKAKDAAAFCKQLAADQPYSGMDAYDIAAMVIKVRSQQGFEGLKLSPAQFEQIRIYQRVRSQYHG